MSSILLTRGIQGNVSTSTPFAARGGADGDQISSDLHGRYYQTTHDRRMYGITGGLTTTTAAGAATFTGLLVGNPAGSGVNLAVNKVFIAQPVALTAETELGIMYGPSTTAITASLTTIFNRYSGGVASACVATAGQTITAPTAFIVISSGGTAVQPVNHSCDLEGSLIIPPGHFFASYTSRVTTTALVFCFNWEEIPV